MMKYKISNEAQNDLENIWLYTFKIGLKNKPTDITIRYWMKLNT